MIKRIKQIGLKDCGPTCLQMIIKHYKGYIDIDTIKEKTNSSKLGTNALDIVNYAKEIGFNSYGQKVTLDDDIILPCIAHVKINDSFNHFVVIEKINKKTKKVKIKDPANIKEKYSRKEFEEIFNGVVIILFPEKTIPIINKYDVNSFIKSLLKTPKIELIQVLIISIFITVLSIITSFYMKIMIDNINYKIEYLYLIFFIFLFIYLLKVFCDYLRNRILILMNQKIELVLNYDSFKQIILLPYLYYKNHTTGELVSRVRDLEIVKDTISKVFISLFIDLPLTIIALIVMYILNKDLFFVSIIIFVLYLLITFIFKNSFKKNIETINNSKATNTSYMVECINGFETIKGINIEKQVLEKYELKLVNHVEKVKKFENIYNNQYLFKELINNIGFICIILVGVILVKDNIITLGTLLAFNTLLGYFFNPIRRIIELDINIHQTNESINRVMNIYKKNKEINLLESKPINEIVINNLSFKINDKEILSDINTKLNSGDKILIYGKSGSGKSTLCKILKKYYDIRRDSIYINNVDIEDTCVNNIKYVGQNEILFTDTIINLVNNNYESLKICLINEILKTRELGINSLILENGINFSGGQKQRLILARTISKNFDVLIIDEGFSQVDPKMEAIILKNLFAKYKNKIIIVVSHRLDNKNLFNKSIHIKDGKIIKEESNVPK